MKIDDTNIAIIKQLRQGRRPFKKIASSLGLSENTVRARIAKMQSEGILEITGLVDPQQIPHHHVVIIGVKLSTVDLVGKGKEFSHLKGVVSASVVTGRFDLILIVLLNEKFNLLEFYTEQLARVDEIQSIETFVVYKSYNLKVPYLI